MEEKSIRRKVESGEIISRSKNNLMKNNLMIDDSALYVQAYQWRDIISSQQKLLDYASRFESFKIVRRTVSRPPRQISGAVHCPSQNTLSILRHRFPTAVSISSIRWNFMEFQFRCRVTDPFLAPRSPHIEQCCDSYSNKSKN